MLLFVLFIMNWFVKSVVTLVTIEIITIKSYYWRLLLKTLSKMWTRNLIKWFKIDLKLLIVKNSTYVIILDLLLMTSLMTWEVILMNYNAKRWMKWTKSLRKRTLLMYNYELKSSILEQICANSSFKRKD